MAQSALEQFACVSVRAESKTCHIVTSGCLWWTDGVGFQRKNTDDLVFDGVRPRVDVCTCQATKGRPLRLAAAQGLWYNPRLSR